MKRIILFLGFVLFQCQSSFAQEIANAGKYIRENFTRQDYQIPMRDGVRLYTIVYAPKDDSREYPILMMRTPYGIGPYEEGQYRGNLGPDKHFLGEGYIFVYQDVRGRYMSEGEFENMRPHNPRHATKKDIDESTDTYDTVDWLIRKIPNNNGKAGQWGISYPGFYSLAGMIDAHPALKAVSPQAPIVDWYFEDFHHHGALFLPHAFNFFSGFGQPRPEPTTKGGTRDFSYGTPDGYKFFLELGPLRNVNTRYFKNRIAFWNRFVEHPNYDSFWQARNLLPHLKKVAPAVMTVGGWFDAENLYGPLKAYRRIEKNNPGIFNVLVMGPWAHGAWSRTDASRLGNIHFGSNSAAFFQKELELPFFNHFLKGTCEHGLPEAMMFETGVNKWRRFPVWPPANLQKGNLFARAGGKLSFAPPEEEDAFDEYISDPQHPVPYTEDITIGMSQAYMTDDQRHASRRPDVVTYQSPALKKNMTLAGPMKAELFVSTTGTDSDWIVKVIDVFPDDAPDSPAASRQMAGYQMLVRSEVFRGRFRNSYSKPEAFTPNEPTKISFELLDVLHTFTKGHRIMIQVSSTWFPLADRNPQKFVPNIFLAEEEDFTKTKQRVYRGGRHPTSLQIGILTGPN